MGGRDKNCDRKGGASIGSLRSTAFKDMIGITPNGAINFISELITGGAAIEERGKTEDEGEQERREGK
ncbi:hypothetical protein TNCV_1534101 [Trichonephila clavipes]|nr:hypothetical protein TNCV_1534101 [Trichonephila clavipes]